MARKSAKTPDVRVGYILCCDAHNHLRGKHDYYGVFDRIWAKSFPVIHQQMHIGVELNGSPSTERTVDLAFCNCDGDDVLPPVKGLKVRFSAYSLAAIQLDVNGVRFPREGIYSIVVRQYGQAIGERMLFIEKGGPNG